MSLTPRQIAAYLDFSAKLDKLDQATRLHIAAVGAQSDGATINKMLKELTEPWR